MVELRARTSGALKPRDQATKARPAGVLRSAARVSSWSCVLSASQNRTACKQLVASSTNENSQPPRASRAANRRSVLSPTHARRWGGLSRRADLRSFGFHGPSSSARISTPCRLSLTLGAWAWNGNPTCITAHPPETGGVGSGLFGEMWSLKVTNASSEARSRVRTVDSLEGGRSLGRRSRLWKVDEDWPRNARAFASRGALSRRRRCAEALGPLWKGPPRPSGASQPGSSRAPA